MTDALLAVLIHDPLNVEPSPTWTWSLQRGQCAAQPWRGVSRAREGRVVDTIVPLVLQRDCMVVWPSELRSHQPHALAHFQHMVWRVCCQDAAAELELSCDLFSRQLEITRWVGCFSATRRGRRCRKRGQGRTTRSSTVVAAGRCAHLRTAVISQRVEHLEHCQC